MVENETRREREMKFLREIVPWLNNVLESWITEISVESGEAAWMDLGSLAVHEKYKVYSGRAPVWQDENRWFWARFDREVDVLIGRRAIVGGDEMVLPLVAIELKTGNPLSTDELDKKGAIYTELKNQHPRLMTCLVVESNEVRRLKDETFLRNARHFDRIITDWNQRSQGILARSIQAHLHYAIGYWGR